MALSLLEQAKAGNAEAITILMNQALKPKGVTVQGQCRGDRLQLRLMATATLDQVSTVNYVLRGFAYLQVKAFTGLEIYALSTDAQTPDWGVEVNLGVEPPEVVPLASPNSQPVDDPPETRPDADATESPAEAPHTMADAYALLDLEPDAPLKAAESNYFKLKAQALRDGDRRRVESLKQAFYQLKDYIQNPPAKVATPPTASPEPPPPAQDDSLPPAQRIEALLKERGVSAQIRMDGNQLHITWLAVRVANPDDAAAQVRALLAQHHRKTGILEGIDTLVISGIKRDQSIVWQQSFPFGKR